MSDNERLHPHEGTVLLTAAGCMGVQVDTADRSYVRTISKLAELYDDLVDSRQIQPDTAALLTDPIGILSTLMPAASAIRLTEGIADMTVRQRATCLEADTLPRFAEMKHSASSLTQLSQALTAEAALFTRLFALDTDNKPDLVARQKFNSWLGHFARGGYHVDEAVDMVTDNREGRVTITPSLYNRSRLWGIGMSELRRSSAYVRSPKFMWVLGKTALLTIREGKRSDVVAHESLATAEA